MNAMQRERLAAAITTLSEAFRQSITAVTIRAYEMALGDLPIESIESACRRSMSEKKFFPNVAELRELCGELTPADRSVIAWQAVLDADAAHGYYGSVDFDDKAINAAVRALGGWEKLDERLETEGRVWVQKEFDRAYQVYCRRGVTPSEAAPLGGFHDRANHGAFPSHVPAAVAIATTLKPTPLIGGQARSRPAIPAQQLLTANIGAMPEERTP